MAFSGTYAKATVTNPSSSLTDFTLIVDLSDMPSSWWSDVDTADGTKGRAAKDDGVTELACDWIDFDNVAETGLVRIKWSGTLSSVGTQIVRIYPPRAANASYASTDTYGSDNAYKSAIERYYPLNSDPNDRTSNSGNLTENGSPTYSDNMVQLNGSSQWLDTSTLPISSQPISILVYADVSSTAAIEYIVGQYNSGSSSQWLSLGLRSPGLRAWDRNSGTIAETLTSYHDNAKHHFALTESSTLLELFADGSFVTSTSDTILSYPFDNLTVGRTGDSSPSNYFNGGVSHIMILSEVVSSAFIDQEHSMVSNNSTFWGTWSYVGAGGYTLTAEKGSYTLTGNDASLLADRVFSAEKGSYTLTGYDASLLADRILTAEKGSFTLTGNDASLLYGRVLTAEKGSYILTGNDAQLLKTYILSAEKGSFTLTGYDAILTWSGQAVAEGKVSVTFTSKAPSVGYTEKAPSITYSN